MADFLGVSKAENETDLIGFNEIHNQSSHDTDYLFPITRLVPVQQATPLMNLDSTTTNTATNNNNNSYDLQDNSNSLQSLTLSMGSGSKASTCETPPDHNTSTNTTTALDVTPRRTLDTFGQRTSIYRGVTR